ncbi:hypothetical protein GOM49_16825 [Clostridium bovifaecis]|uniref:Uncharacterized protein n=1 Tax=Clostridium bovifaecis TaxID=2184719 RepID=A0A6I6F7S5_9CLOT|nr:hypothetical protein GOM49_16825 [Clostridium bovifaecis]
MSEYHLDIIGRINLGDYSKIHDYMGIVDIDDKFTITFNNNSIESSDIIYNMLENNNFNVYSKGGNKDGKLYITASRSKR